MPNMPLDTKELRSEIEKSLKLIESVPRVPTALIRDTTRSRIAVAFTHGFFVILTLIICGVPVYNLAALSLGQPSLVLELKDTLIVISGIISGPFGFVLGYYFKSSDKEK